MREVFADELLPLFGTIAPPIKGYSANVSGLTVFATNILRLAFLGAGLYVFLNFILAGFAFLTAAEPKAIANAWQKIYLSVVGLVIIVGSFILAGVVGWLIFGDPLFILRPTIYGPGT